MALMEKIGVEQDHEVHEYVCMYICILEVFCKEVVQQVCEVEYFANLLSYDNIHPRTIFVVKSH